MKDKIIKWMLFFLGILFLSLGISLMIWAQAVGLAPWDSFHLGLTNYLPFNVGQICQFVGAIAVVIGMLLGVMPKLGTILNTIVIGWLVNIFLDIFPKNNFIRIDSITIITFVLGLIVCGIGSGLYISADLGIGPRDSIMIGLNRKLGIKIGVARTFLEISIAILAFLLSGPIGIGTIIFSLSIGFFIEKTLKFLRNHNISMPSQEGKSKYTSKP